MTSHINLDICILVSSPAETYTNVPYFLNALYVIVLNIQSASHLLSYLVLAGIP